MYKVPCNNPFILFSLDSWSKPAQLFKSQLLATAYTSPWGYASVILLWSCMSNGINSHKKCVRRQPKVSNPAAVLNFWNSELSSFSISLLKFSLMLQSIQSWSLGKFAFLYIFSVMLSLGLFTCFLCTRIFFLPSNSKTILYTVEFQREVTSLPPSPPGEYTTWSITTLAEVSQAQLKKIWVRERECVCVCVSEYSMKERRNNDVIITIP